jgi:hypothetical protein
MGAGKYARMMRRGGVDPCLYVPGLYTEAEVDDLINIDGYIPVASAVEFDKIRTGASETMGGCSIWAGTYTTGVDKKYIQVFNIDFTAFGTWTTPILAFAGTYDGNNLNITNHVGLYFFLGSTSLPCELVNIRDVNVSISSSTSSVGSIGAIARAVSSGSLVKNIYVSGTVSTTTIGASLGTGGIIGIAGTSSGSKTTIENCIFEGTVSADYLCGGIVGSIINTDIIDCSVINSTIENTNVATITTITDSGGLMGTTQMAASTITGCSVIDSTMNFRGRSCGGFIARDRIATTISDCKVENCTVTHQGTQFVGGFIGLSFTSGTTIQRCYSSGSTTKTGINAGHGGFTGTNGVPISECYSTMNVTSPSASGADFGTGGFVGDNRAGSVIEDCYAYGTVLGRNEVGGFAGRGDGTIRYSYSTGSATGNTDVGGFIGRVTTTNSQTAAYWDTVTSGNATSAGAGTSGETTTDLQTPTSNTGIYAAWTIPPWDFGTSTDYPVLTTTP